MIFQNQREAAAKRLAADAELTNRGSLRQDVRQRVQAECKAAWAAMSDEERGQFRELYKARLEERKQEAQRLQRPAETAERLPLSLSSHWAFGSKCSTVHPKYIQEFFTAGGKLPSTQEVYDAGEFRVDPADTDPTPLLGQDVSINGCPMKGRNSCQNDGDQVVLRAITNGLSRLVEAAGRSFAKSGDLLLVAESLSTDASGATARLFALVTAPVFSPIFQDLTMCSPPAGVDVSSAELPFPFELDIQVGASRLAGLANDLGTGFLHSTSDEFGKAMLARATAWQLCALDYEVLSGMKMRVTGASTRPDLRVACQGKAPAIRQKRHAALSMLDSLDRLQGDPLAPPRPGAQAGGPRRRKHAGSGRVSSAPSSMQPVARADPSPEGQDDLAQPLADASVVDDGPDGEEDLFGDFAILDAADSHMDMELCALAAGIVEDVGDLQRADEDDDAPDGSGPTTVAEGAGASSSSAPSTEEGLEIAGVVASEVLQASGWADPEPVVAAPAAEPDVAPQPQRPDGAMDIPGAPAGWSKTPGGYVFDAAHRKVGRLTSWGSHVSMKCSFHSSCSLAKGRRAATDNQLMSWLALAAPGAEGANDIGTALAHKYLWYRVIASGGDGGRPPQPAPSS